jgi:Holliday junction resolvasome RuvABC endonuclease subunit
MTEEAESELLRLMTHDQAALPTAVKILFDERLARFEARANAIERRITETNNSILGLIGANEKAVGVAMTAADRAVAKAETAAERRFESVNEFRKALGDQTATLVTRSENATELRSMNDKIDALNTALVEVSRRLNKQEGKGIGYQQSWGIFISLAGLAVLIIVEFLLRRP